VKKEFMYDYCIFKDGSEVENTQFSLMPHGVVEQYMQRAKFVNRPGRRIKNI